MAIIMYNRLINLKNLISTNNSAIGILYNTTQNLINTSRLCTSIIEDIESESDNTSARTKKKLSKAMRAYLQRAQEHEKFMKQEITEYDIGKRHLANIMGENAETFTQKDIDRSIQYLFPSGLYDWRARPLIRPPEEIFPDRKAAEFDESGRPYDSLFYTQNPNYYSALHDLAVQMEALNQLEDQKLRKGVLPSPEEKAQLLGSSWLSKVDLEALFLEALLDKQYEYFVASFERLVHHPMSAHASEFLMKYRKAIITQVQEGEIQPIEYGSDGRPFVKVTQCMRKSARGTVTVTGEGSGKITVNGEMLTTRFDLQSREQIIFPLIFTGLAEQVDVEATVTGGGTTGQSGAIRWGIAWALRSFVDKKMLEKMKIAGLLTRDWRTRERKKPGQEGARRKFTWNKR